MKLTRDDWDQLTRRLIELANRCSLVPYQWRADPNLQTRTKTKVEVGVGVEVEVEGDKGDECQPYEQLKVGLVTLTGEHLGAFAAEYPSLQIVMSGCQLRCRGCLYHEIAWNREGQIVTEEELSETLLEAQEIGAGSVTFMTATHQAHLLIPMLHRAVGQGFCLPVVWYVGGYEYAHTIELLAPLIDIFVSDLKFVEDEVAAPYVGVPDYATVAKKALAEAYKLLGGYTQSPEPEDGIGRGVIIKHLALPGCFDQTQAVLEFIASKMKEVPVELVRYVPTVHTEVDRVLRARISADDLELIIQYGKKLGLDISAS